MAQPESRRFSRVIAALVALKTAQPTDGDLQREVDYAISMIQGRRPGIEAKYDALLLKLDRTYTQLEDWRDHISERDSDSPLAGVRYKARAKIKAVNRLLTDLAWMRARNSDLIKAAHGSISKDQETELPAEVPEQAD